jgi:hypothetical protein
VRQPRTVQQQAQPQQTSQIRNLLKHSVCIKSRTAAVHPAPIHTQGNKDKPAAHYSQLLVKVHGHTSQQKLLQSEQQTRMQLTSSCCAWSDSVLPLKSRLMSSGAPPSCRTSTSACKTRQQSITTAAYPKPTPQATRMLTTAGAGYASNVARGVGLHPSVPASLTVAKKDAQNGSRRSLLLAMHATSYVLQMLCCCAEHARHS